MKKILFAYLLLPSIFANAQIQKISTIDFVQILNNNRAEAIYYYENNWLELRKLALEKGFVDSYEIIEVAPSDNAPFDLVLKTTYSDKEAFEKAEERFQKLIEEQGALKLMNDKKPGEFRKVIFSKAQGIHLF